MGIIFAIAKLMDQICIEEITMDTKKETNRLWKAATILLFLAVLALSGYIWRINCALIRVNSNGETYNTGSIDYFENPNIRPTDLERAIGKNGKIGYIRRKDTEGPIVFEGEESEPYEIPLYKSDGVTQIDVFVIG